MGGGGVRIPVYTVCMYGRTYSINFPAEDLTRERCDVAACNDDDGLVVRERERETGRFFLHI